MKSFLTGAALFCVSCVILAACATAPDTQLVKTRPAVKQPTVPVRPLVKAVQLDSPRGFKTSKGSIFKVPAKWWVSVYPDRIFLQDPERELTLWLVDIPGKVAGAAIKEAWARSVPGFKLEILLEATPPATNGWDGFHDISYKFPTLKGRRYVKAVARQKDGVFYVVLIDAPIAALQRRGAQLRQIVHSQKAKGLKYESLVGKKAKAWNDAIAAKLDTFIKKGMKQTGVPGLAIAILQGGKVVFEKGYGVRGPKGRPVTPVTRFMIGSNSKSFTSLMIARLVDQGKVSWDTPVQKLLPRFTLGDKAVAKKLLLHHALCACTGLPSQDMEIVFQYKGISGADRLAELATVKPTTGFGETFQYSNPLVAAAGFAAGRACYPRKSMMAAYGATLRKTVLKPLALKATTFDTRRVIGKDHAMPYGRRLDSSYLPIPLSWEGAMTAMAPAGGLWSNVRDLARVMQMELNAGLLSDGTRFVTKKNLLRRRQSSVKIGVRSAYGLAMMIKDRRGLMEFGHPGNTLGFTATNNFYPQHNMGIIILANAAVAHSLLTPINRKWIELLFDGTIAKADKHMTYQVKLRTKSNAFLASKLTSPPPKAWITPLLGTYTHAALGTLVVKWQGTQVVADVGEWASPLALYSDVGIKILIMTGPPLPGLPFNPQKDGSLLLDMGQQKYTFVKRK
jgi:CubicO group peptidase (beta-lactamase class C family)